MKTLAQLINSPGNDIRIWYYRDEEQQYTWRINYYERVLVNNLEHTHVCIGEIGASPNILEEELFQLMQGENWSPNGEANELIRSCGISHTSMSVGDIIEFSDGRLIMVASVGFIPLIGFRSNKL